MSRKMSKASLENLKKGKQINEDIAREYQLEGAKVKRTRRTFKEIDAEITSEDELKEMLVNLKRRAKKNSKDFELYRDTIGQKPVEKVQTCQINPDIQAEIDKLFE